MVVRGGATDKFATSDDAPVAGSAYIARIFSANKAFTDARKDTTTASLSSENISSSSPSESDPPFLIPSRGDFPSVFVQSKIIF